MAQSQDSTIRASMIARASQRDEASGRRAEHDMRAAEAREPNPRRPAWMETGGSGTAAVAEVAADFQHAAAGHERGQRALQAARTAEALCWFSHAALERRRAVPANNRAVRDFTDRAGDALGAMRDRAMRALFDDRPEDLTKVIEEAAALADSLIRWPVPVEGESDEITAMRHQALQAIFDQAADTPIREDR